MYSSAKHIEQQVLFTQKNVKLPQIIKEPQTILMYQEIWSSMLNSVQVPSAIGEVQYRSTGGRAAAHFHNVDIL